MCLGTPHHHPSVDRLDSDDAPSLPLDQGSIPIVAPLPSLPSSEEEEGSGLLFH